MNSPPILYRRIPYKYRTMRDKTSLARTARQPSKPQGASVAAPSRPIVGSNGSPRVPRNANVPPAPRRKAAAAPRQAAVRTQTGGPKVSSGPSAHDQLSSSLTSQERAIAEYLHGLTTPNYPTKVPLLLGEFELNTSTYEFQNQGIATASSAGVAFCAVGADGWFSTGADIPGAPFEQFASLGGTGLPLWATPAGGAATVTPVVSAAATASAAGSGTLPKLDPGWDANTRLRLTAVIAEFWSDAPLQTAQGDITVAVCDTSEALQGAALNNANFSQVAAYPQNFVRHEEYPLSGWPSGTTISVHLTPFDMQCVAMNLIAGSGKVTAPTFAIAAIGAGMATGQTFRWKVTMKYESTVPQTYQTNLILDNTVGVEVSNLLPAWKAMKPNKVTMGPTGHTKAKGLSALAEVRPTTAKKIAKLAREPARPGVVDFLKDAAKELVGEIPYVGGLLKTGLGWLLG